MKTLYKVETRISVNGVEWPYGVQTELHYGELPENKTLVEIFDFDAALLYVEDHKADCRRHGVHNYVPLGFLQKYTNLKIDLDLFKDSADYIDRKNFKYLNKTQSFVRDSNYTIQQLSKKLPADEFVQWCLDTGQGKLSISLS